MRGPPVGLLAIAAGALGAILVGSIITDDDDVRLGGTQPSEGNKDSFAANPAAAAAGLDCNQALEIFAAREGVEAANALATAINEGTNGNALRDVAVGLEARAAGAPDLPASYRAALLRLSRCVYDKLATLPVARVGQTPGLASTDARELARRTVSQFSQPATPPMSPIFPTEES